MSGFEAAVERHQRKIYTFARYFLGNEEEAADITQEVLIRLWQRWRQVDGDRMGPWLTKVTRNACFDRLRQRRSAARIFVPETDDGQIAERYGSGAPGPQARAEATDFRRHLRGALEEIGEPYKSIIILREVQGLKYQEISDALDMPLNTVRVYLHRGRRRLREQLREVYGHAATA